MRKITYTQALAEALEEEMIRDEKVFQIGEDIGKYGGVWLIQKDQLEKFGEMRMRQTPISENGFVGMAVGAALTGLRPVVELMYIDFITTAMDQVVNQMAKLNLMSGGAVKMPMVIRSEQGSGSREGAQHSQSFESWFVHTPGIKVVIPSTPYDAKGLLKSAIRDDEPVIFLEHRSLYGVKGEVPEEEYLIPIGKGIRRREGNDVTVIATSYFLGRTLSAVDELAKEGIAADVIDPRSLMPIDIDLIVESVKKTGRLIIVQEGTVICSVGAEIVRQVIEKAFDYLDAPPRVIGGAHVPMPFSPPLEDLCLTSMDDIKKAIKNIVA